MKECELCDVPARVYCESDQAGLCWDCDAKVHCANFLVARHLRNLLCQVCQHPTPWQASGPKLSPTVSVCDRCVSRCHGQKESEGETDSINERNEEEEEEDDEDDDSDDDDDDGDGDDEEDEDDEEGEMEDGENQVVPWSSTPPPPVASSSSSSEAEESSTRTASLKRRRETADLSFEDDLDCSSSHHRFNAASTARISANDESTSSRSALMGSIKRYRRSGVADVLDICKLRRGTKAVDLFSTTDHSHPI